MVINAARDERDGGVCIFAEMTLQHVHTVNYGRLSVGFVFPAAQIHKGVHIPENMISHKQ